MTLKNLFFPLVLLLAALTASASGLQCLGQKANFKHQNKLMPLSHAQLFNMGAEFCKHKQLKSLPLLYPGYELILGVFFEDDNEKLFHMWEYDKQETGILCEHNYRVKYYYIPEDLLTHDFKISAQRHDFFARMQSSEWHRIFKNQISNVGFEFIEQVIINISDVKYTYKLDNLTLSKLINNISLDLFAALIITPMLAELGLDLKISHSIESNKPKIELSNKIFSMSFVAGLCLRQNALCLGDFIFETAAKMSNKSDFAPLKDKLTFDYFNAIDLQSFSSAEDLDISHVQIIIDYYLNILKNISQNQYEKYKNTQAKSLSFN